MVVILLEKATSGRPTTVTVHSYRRFAFGSGPIPVAGSVIASKSGKTMLHVVKTTTFRRSGEPIGKDLIRMELRRLPKDSVAIGALPWPILPKVVPIPRTVDVATQFKSLVKMVPEVTASRSRKQRKRNAMRVRHVSMIAQESLIPRAQLDAVMKDGEVVCPPKVAAAVWRDPDDTNRSSRTPKLSHGYRRSDPLVKWAMENKSIIGREEVAAADCYRLAYELGPCQAMPNGRSLSFVDRQFSSASGPTEIRLQRMRDWTYVQSLLANDAKAILFAVVLNRTSISKWAADRGGDRRHWSGTLCAILKQLYVIYRDDVDASLKQDGSVLD